jgi:hypothetical protein
MVYGRYIYAILYISIMTLSTTKENRATLKPPNVRSVWLRSKRLAPMLWPVVPGGETPRVVRTWSP